MTAKAARRPSKRRSAKRTAQQAPERVIETGYRPRKWQSKVQDQLLRFSCLNVHRRGGKTVLACNTLISAAVACTRPAGRFAYLAPFVSQARRVAWPYVKQYARPIPGTVFNETLATATLQNGTTIALYGADNPDALRGLYFDGIVLDEVADMRPQVWGEIVRPALTDRNGWALFIGTPKGLNLFSAIYHRALREDDWFAATLTCYDTDALLPEEIDRAKKEMSEREFDQEMMCSFQAGTEDALISLEVARAAAERKLAPSIYKHAARVIGVDVARYGDDCTAIVKRQGDAIHGIQVLRDHDTMEVASAVAGHADQWKADVIFIDVGGIGSGVFDRLKQLGYRALPVDFGSKPTDARFANKRAEIWWLMAEWLPHASIPDDERLIAELCAPKISYANARGRVELESKDQMRKRGLSSPDVADALATTFASPVVPRWKMDKRVGKAKFEYDPMKDSW